MEKTYQIEGMHCSACAAAVERILKKQPHVTKASVNLVMEEVLVEHEAGYVEEQAIAAVQKGGFTMKPKTSKQTETFPIEGMYCAACSAGVERILKRFDEIEDASVNLVMNNVTITYQTDKFEDWQSAVAKGGYKLKKAQKTQRYTLDVEDMTCASCAASLEAAMKKQPGVVHAEFNLLTETAIIEVDPSLMKLSEVLQVVENTGYRAHLHQEEHTQVEQKDYENVRIYTTLGLALVLLYIGMSHMLGSFELPLPEIIYYKTHPFNFAFVQFLLATIILVLGRHFFTRGFRALFHKAPNMDTLVAVGTGSAYLYSVFSMLAILQGNVHAVHALYFESAGVVVALVQDVYKRQPSHWMLE